MTHDPQEGQTANGSGPLRSRVEAKEEHVAWPPSPTAVLLFVVVMFSLGGPFTWWAVSR